ncbi:MAG: polysaccharide biosynthesis/export family protein [Bacteroidota bacterium]|nr:polysaccharide biosynthesis/export family protein [Bacteroidota bacterium]
MDLHEQGLTPSGKPDSVPDYRIGRNDILYISILTMNPDVNQMFSPMQGNSTMSVGTQQMYGDLTSQYLNGYEVNAAGNIVLPIMGTVHVGGLTLADAQDTVQVRAGQFLKDAAVKLKLLSFRVTVMGEVNSPGVYYNYRNNLTVLEAISMAKGLTDYASPKRVLVIRQTIKGKENFYLDLSGKNALNSPAYYLKNDDVVYVEPEKYKQVKVNAPLYSIMLSAISTAIVVFSFVITSK